MDFVYKKQILNLGVTNSKSKCVLYTIIFFLEFQSLGCMLYTDNYWKLKEICVTNYIKTSYQLVAPKFRIYSNFHLFILTKNNLCSLNYILKHKIYTVFLMWSLLYFIPSRGHLQPSV